MNQEALHELVDGIISIMKERVISIVLYGSVARGTNTDDSDVDIAILVRSALNNELDDALSDFVVDMNLKHDRVFSVIDIDYDTFRSWEKAIPYYRNVNEEGIVLWTAA